MLTGKVTIMRTVDMTVSRIPHKPEPQDGPSSPERNIQKLVQNTVSQNIC